MSLFPGRCPGWLGFSLALKDLFGGVALVAGVRVRDLLCDSRRSERGKSDRAEKVVEKHCMLCLSLCCRTWDGNGGGDDGKDRMRFKGRDGRNNRLSAYLSSYLEVAFGAAVWACDAENGQ